MWQAPLGLCGPDGQLDLLLECVTGYALFLIDTEGRVISWNAGAGRLFGYDEAEVVGRHFALFFVPEDLETREPDKELRAAAKTGRVSNELWHARKDRTRLWLSSVTTALRDEQGDLRGYARVSRDDTRWKQVEAELRERTAQLAEADRRTGRFLAVLAHEMGNILAPLSTGVHLLQLNGGSGASAEKALSLVERQVEQLARLVRDISDVSSVQQGMVQLWPQVVELAPALAVAVETSRPYLDARKNELTVTLPPVPIHVEADPARLVQVFANLLTHAAKYSREGGPIWLTAQREGEQAVMRVRDDGVGIAPERLSHIFSLFTPVEESPGGSRGRLDLGLSLVKHLVELHGGTVAARSDGVGKGSEFVVRLPIKGTGSRSAHPRP